MVKIAFVLESFNQSQPSIVPAMVQTLADQN